MPTIYISGQITGLELEIAQQNFIEAAELLSCLGVDPVNPFENGLTQEHSWEQHMLRDIEMLMSCDGVFMLSNWTKSRGARIERNVAIETGKIILYESLINDDYRKIRAIKNAINDVLLLKYEDYTQASRRIDFHFARLIFTHQVQKLECMELHDVATSLHRSYSNVRKYISKYCKEYAVNKQFRAAADKTDSLITKYVSL